MKRFFHINFDIGISESADCWEYGYLNNSQMGDMHSMTIEEKGDSFTCIRYCKKFTNEEVVHDSPLASLKFIEKYAPYFDLSFKEFENVLGISAFTPNHLPLIRP